MSIFAHSALPRSRYSWLEVTLMLRVDMTAQQARAAAALLQQALASLEEVPSYDTLEALVLACRALRHAADEPEAAAKPAAPKKARAAAPREPEAADEGG